MDEDMIEYLYSGDWETKLVEQQLGLLPDDDYPELRRTSIFDIIED